MWYLRVSIAHFISPIVGLVVYQFIYTSHLIFPVTNRLNVAFKYYLVGFDSLFAYYFFVVMLSIPVFYIVSRMMGEGLRYRLLSSAFVVSSLVAIGLMGDIIGFDYSTLMFWRIASGIVLGVLVHGGIFWLLTRRNEQKGTAKGDETIYK